MPVAQPYRIKTISEFHQLLGLPRPEHPLISVINLEGIQSLPKELSGSRTFDFYTISLKRYGYGRFNYGQQAYDGQDGVMYFMAPGQVFSPPLKNEETNVPPMSGWALYVHPDFLWHTALAKSIKKYDYFDYSVHEALYLTEREEATIIGILQSIQTEYFANTDTFSQDIIIALTDVLLNYADRFYSRQFLTRKIENHQLLDRLEACLTGYFNSNDLMEHGPPSVQLVASQLNISPNYLSTLLKLLTGRTTQQHIQDKMIEKAKEKIAGTRLTVSEISYGLGVEHPQSFSRLFKAKTGLSPVEFRQSFN
ncbi:helix-turn-helix domain-containing protein [Spirosoma pollinicola]|uniref:AraC family transcriptional regulator n=1 Tax=Spirosoma pollinicola TaxID=2057025 RepID=A0A2K8Z9R5_9BACT|nr:AraC family transcriptional regulator [Spirosoma pollinicola]AUD06597.1 AraC family transcriptional regulator [Spirosoma pollinicola]